MAEVLTRSRDDQPYYSGSSLKRSAPSRTSLLVGSPPQSSSLRPAASEPSFAHFEGLQRSLPSSSSLATRQSYSDFSQLSQPPSFSSTPASTYSSTLSFESNPYRDDEEISFPAYDEVQFFHEEEALPPSPRAEDEQSDLDTRSLSDASQASQDEQASTTESTHSDSILSDSTRSDSPLSTPTVADDTAIKHEPSRHVDYLSHDWREEDIWSSWRHIVSQRKVYGQKSRLENASWRTWAKSKYHLATVSPEELNWLKESDVTWLYGPLQPAVTHPVTNSASNTPSQLSKSNSFVGKTKKPILKKRSMSEVMLQRSLSASSLVKQAAASIQAQQHIPPRRPTLSRTTSAFESPAGLSVPPSRDHLDFLDLDYFSPRPSSGEETPLEGPKRHIRFDDKVEQCIAVDCKDCEDDDEDEDSDRNNRDSDSDSSDDGIVMMKRPKRKRLIRRSVSRSSSANSRTIEKLPDAKLKYKSEEPITPQSAPVIAPFGNGWNWTSDSSSNKLSPSASQETLRPVSPPRSYVLPLDDEDDDFDAETFRSSAFANRRDSIHVRRAQTTDSTDSSMVMDEQGLKRSNSGMFIPYEEDEDDLVAAGLFGKVSDTINTAKDIAHVIWNVGWRS